MMKKITLLLAVLASGTLMAQNRPGGNAPAQATGPVNPVFDKYVQPDVSFDVYFTKSNAKPVSPDKDGFIRRWTLLDPISKLDINSNTLFSDSWLKAEFEKNYFDGQKTVLPKDGEQVTVKVMKRAPMTGMRRGGMGMGMGNAPQQPVAQQPAPAPEYEDATLNWHSVDSKRYNVKLYRFAKSLGLRPTSGLFLGVTVVNAPEDMTVRLAAGSNSASMWYVNEEEVLLMSGDRRMVVDDCVSKRITLKKGKNIVRCSVINGPGMSDFCVRFIGEDGKPVTNLTITNP